MSADVNERFRAKLQARREETTEVKTYPAAPHHPTATDADSIDGRFQAKLLAHQGQPTDVEKVENARVAALKAKAKTDAGKGEGGEKASGKGGSQKSESGKLDAGKGEGEAAKS